MQLDQRHPNNRVTLPAMPTRRSRLWGDSDGNLAIGTGDGGYTLALVAMMMIPMMVMVSFAVDLGSWYAQSSKMQRAADAASMAGDVWLPNRTNADTAAQNAAKANGYTIACNTQCAQIGDTDYKVTITAPVSRFFSQVFGTAKFDMTRTATARFNKKIPLGSPSNSFGNNIDTTSGKCGTVQYQPMTTAPCGPSPMLWSAINGPYQAFENGDPYSTKCASGGSSGQSNKSTCDDSSGTLNPNGLHAKNQLYRDTGYNYAVDVTDTADIGKTLTVELYDITSSYRTVDKSSGGGGYTGDCNSNAAPFNATPYTDTASSWGASQCQTGDSGGNWTGTGTGTGGAAKDINDLNMDGTLYQNDGSDLSVSYAGVQASTGGTGTLNKCNKTYLGGISVTGYKNAWTTLCTFTPTQLGIYPLRIKASGIASVTDAGDSYNAFSLRVTGGTVTRLYALEDLSIWSNIPGSTSRFYLAEIGPENAGKKIQLDMYDPGDGSGSTAFTMQVLAPSTTASQPPAVTPTTGTNVPGTGTQSCQYNATASSTKGGGTLTDATNCTVTTKNAGSGTGIYNGKWLRIEIKLKTDYTCNALTTGVGNCWWTIKYDFGGAGLPTDRTVWSLTVVGDPVHLVE